MKGMCMVLYMYNLESFVLHMWMFVCSTLLTATQMEGSGYESDIED